MVETIVKRDGSTKKFHPGKIVISLEKAFAHARNRKKLKETAWMDEIAEKVRKMRPKSMSSDLVRKIVVDELVARKMKDVASHYEFSFLKAEDSPLTKVIKRSGKKEKFDPKKVYKSIRKAFSMAGIHKERECERLTKTVISRLEKKFGSKLIPVESIRDETGKLLMEHGHEHAANRYMLHRFM